MNTKQKKETETKRKKDTKRKKEKQTNDQVVLGIERLS